MMATHTPGPWRWKSSFRLHGQEDVEVLDIGLGYDGLWDGEPPSEPDARLIAAAPDLLAACMALCEAVVTTTVKDARTLWSHEKEAIDAARAAIEKTKGVLQSESRT